MKTPQEILKEKTIRTLAVVEGSPLHAAVIEAMKEYAKEVAKQALINASENARIIKSGNGGSFQDDSVCKMSITDENNIPNLD